MLTAAHCVLLYVRLLSHLKLNMSQIFSLIEVHVGINQHVSSTSNITEDDSSSSTTSSSSSHLGNDNVYGVDWFDWHTDFKFTPSVLYNDIAILKLNRPVNLNRPQVDRHIYISYIIQHIIYSTPYLKFFLCARFAFNNLLTLFIFFVSIFIIFNRFLYILFFI